MCIWPKHEDSLNMKMTSIWKKLIKKTVPGLSLHNLSCACWVCGRCGIGHCRLRASAPSASRLVFYSYFTCFVFSLFPGYSLIWAELGPAQFQLVLISFSTRQLHSGVETRCHTRLEIDEENISEWLRHSVRLLENISRKSSQTPPRWGTIFAHKISWKYFKLGNCGSISVQHKHI